LICIYEDIAGGHMFQTVLFNVECDVAEVVAGYDAVLSLR